MKAAERIAVNERVCAFKSNIFSVVKRIATAAKRVVIEDKVLRFGVDIIGIEGVVF
ncbi:hypothetical protein Hpkin38_08480 [Helicobacter pylori]